MGNCLACVPEGRRRREAKLRSHKVVVPLNDEEEGLPRTAHASSCTTTTESTARPTCSKPKRSVRFAEEAVDGGGGGGADQGEKKKCAGVRVKVVLTKKEAAQLLSTLLAEDNERSLKSISAGTLRGGGSKLGMKPSPCPLFKRVPGYDSFWRPELESIPENNC